MIKVNELFAGIGAFRKALINLDIPHEIVGISEIDKFAIQSYEAMYCPTRNYGDISKIARLDYADLWTYGFPCQDVSIMGKMQGIVKGKTRSGLLYEVERLLEVAQSEGTLPRCLILENIKNLVQGRFVGDFERWIDKLSELGYETKWKVLSASDYGIPQKRERVYAVSIRKKLNGGYFRFPDPIPLQIKFRDLLEQNPDKKYFLKQETFEYLKSHSEECKRKGYGFRFSPVARDECEIAKTITTEIGKIRMDDNFIQEKNCKQAGKLVGNKFKNRESISRVYDADSLCPTITAGGGGHHEVKIVVPETTKHLVRKLTPRECWRLMGFTDSDFEKAQSVCSNTQLYKQAGNSIVVNVLEEILKKLVRIN